MGRHYDRPRRRLVGAARGVPELHRGRPLGDTTWYQIGAGGEATVARLKQWTAARAARAAREARIATVAHLRNAPIARQWQEAKLQYAYQLAVEQVEGHRDVGMINLMGGMGFAPPYPPDWDGLVGLILDDEAAGLAATQLYVLSPSMCDVVLAAAQTLTLEDLSLLSQDDLPSPTGLLVLPHPVLVRATNGDLGDDRAYTWRTPATLVRPSLRHRGVDELPAIRTSAYHDAHGPVRPDSFLDMAALAAAQGTPLPPLLLDAMRNHPFGLAPTPLQLQALQDYIDRAARYGEANRAALTAQGQDESRVEGEYHPGQIVDDHDLRHTERFLYAFWRLCAQEVAEVSDAPVNHSARVTAERAGVAPEVRVVNVRTTDRPADSDPAGGRDWHHRWVVRMHKVRQWYPSEQRHKIIYRGPYVKGPAGKPLLGGEVVRAVR